jgi:2-keto-4-pentenoate hydratase/2-oxohepta-3-ene-1,7-dioic acid hydratase in catechol pathway
MKLFRFGVINKEKPGIITLEGTKLDVSAFGEDFNESFFESDGVRRLSEWLKKNIDKCPVVGDKERIGSCIARPSKIVCVGLNYAKHAEETKAAIPDEPILFFKATSALCGPYDPVIIPKNSTKTDWEVELAVIIGKKASYISEAEAMDFVAGYALHNDYSEREFQLERNGQWVKGKSADTFAPLGPFMATRDEVENPNELDLWLSVNGEKLQYSNTNDMIFKVPFLVSYISQFMTLLPGDVISTGTPFGVGLGFSPPKYLKAGDVVELGIEGLGMQKQIAVSYV